MANGCKFCSMERERVKPVPNGENGGNFMELALYSHDRALSVTMYTDNEVIVKSDLAEEGFFLNKVGKRRLASEFIINFCPMCGRKLT